MTALEIQQLTDKLKEDAKEYDVVSLVKKDAIVSQIMEAVAKGEEITQIVDTIFQAGIVKQFSKFRQIAKAAEASALKEIHDNS